jgi:hypothetical protein
MGVRYLESKTAAIDRGYRQTAQRAMILAEVKAAEGHLTAGEIFERVRRKDPKVAYGTVYRSLHLLARHVSTFSGKTPLTTAPFPQVEDLRCDQRLLAENHRRSGLPPSHYGPSPASDRTLA